MSHRRPGEPETEWSFDIWSFTIGGALFFLLWTAVLAVLIFTHGDVCYGG